MDSHNVSINNFTDSKSSMSCLGYQFCQRYKFDYFVEATTVQFILIIILTIITPVVNGAFILMVYLFEELRHTSNYFVLNVAIVNITFGFGSFFKLVVVSITQD